MFSGIFALSENHTKSTQNLFVLLLVLSCRIRFIQPHVAPPAGIMASFYHWRTYRPGASSRGGWCDEPMGGGGPWGPLAGLSQFTQSVHQEPRAGVCLASHFSGCLRRVAGAAQYFFLDRSEGGLTMPAMWPSSART